MPGRMLEDFNKIPSSSTYTLQRIHYSQLFFFFYFSVNGKFSFDFSVKLCDYNRLDNNSNVLVSAIENKKGLSKITAYSSLLVH